MITASTNDFVERQNDIELVSDQSWSQNNHDLRSLKVQIQYVGVYFTDSSPGLTRSAMSLQDRLIWGSG